MSVLIPLCSLLFLCTLEKVVARSGAGGLGLRELIGSQNTQSNSLYAGPSNYGAYIGYNPWGSIFNNLFAGQSTYGANPSNNIFNTSGWKK